MLFSLLWVPVTLMAAAAQTARNATQRRLTAEIGTLGATKVRFLYGLPFAALFLLLVALVTGESVPTPGGAGFAYLVAGAVSQIAATALMLVAMKARSFSITTAYIKTEPVLTAIAGYLLIGDALTPWKVAGILVATAGVIVASAPRQVAAGMLAELRPAFLGIVAGGLFGLSAVAFRGAILELPSGGFVMRATTILVWSLATQTLLLVAWLAVADRRALTASFRVWQPSLAAGFLGALASQCWFVGFALTSAANVRTLALVEVLMALVVSRRGLGESVGGREIAGIALMAKGVGIVLWQAAG
jgi:drug/metabolite transporter (DMT)-like permease